MAKSAIAVILLSLWNCQESSSETFPSQSTTRQWARNLQDEFKKITSGVTDLTGSVKFQKKYQDSIDSLDVRFEHPDGHAIVADMASDIAEIYEKNIKALENLRLEAEKAVRDYTYDEELTLRHIDYINLNDLNNTRDGMAYSRHFRQDILTEETSGVHVPLEIYEGYPEILNGIRWTAALDEAFIRNSEEYPDIYWQSFGSQEGYLRVYPAARWHTVDDLPDLFDVRRRPWYIHGSVSPKDMIILLDTSGSMHGQSFDIMKLAAKTLINTLSENDYVNVASFARNVTWVTPCLDTLVQANARNKRLLFDGIDKLQDHDIASYGKALDFAHQEFQSFLRHREDVNEDDGADCHKLVMLFSDGGTEYPEKAIQRFQNDSELSTTRIFTFAVGPHPLPTVALKNMACVTGGAFSTITAMGAIRTKVQDYARVLNRPLVLTKHGHVYETHSSRDHLGLGLVTTLTLPVYNVSMESDNQTLAGVVGVDIPVFTLESLAPIDSLGPLGYAFGINQNGFLVFHPRLWLDLNYLEDPMHIDFADVEGDNDELKDLRRRMINREDGYADISTSVLLQPGHAISLNMEYHYTKVPGSTFTLGIAIPKDWNSMTLPAVDKEVVLTLDPLNSVLAKRSYCEDIDELSDDLDILQLVQEKVKEGKCQGESINHLAFDVSVTKTTFDTMEDDERNVHSRFLMTTGGLTMFSPHNTSLHDLWTSSGDPRNSSLFKSAMTSRTPLLFLHRHVTREPTVFTLFNDTLVTDTRVPAYGSEPLDDLPAHALHLLSAVRIEDRDGSATVAAVAGVHLKTDFVHGLLMDAAANADGQEFSCGDTEDVRCFLVDHAGYVMAANSEDVGMGDFLGEVDPQLMKYMVTELELFNEHVEFNYQALCPDPLECASAAPSVRTAMQSVWFGVRLVVGWMEQMHLGALSLLSGLFMGTDAILEYGTEISEGLHRCTTKTSTWFLKPDLDGSEFHVHMTAPSCSSGTCNRDAHVHVLDGVNGVLVVTVPDQCPKCTFTDQPVEVLDDAGDCRLPRRYRRRPEKCFAFDEREISECSFGPPLSPNTLVTILFIIVPSLVSCLVWKA